MKVRLLFIGLVLISCGSPAAPPGLGIQAVSGSGEKDGVKLRIDLDKAVIRKNKIEITLREAGSEEAAAPIAVPWAAAPATRRREVIMLPGSKRTEERPIRPESRARLIEGIAKARLWLNELIDGRVTDTKEIADREDCSDRSIRMTLSLAFLSPTIVQAAVDGTLPQGHGVSRLLELPVDWQKQMQIMAPPL